VLTAGVLSSFATVPTQGPIVGIFNQPMRDDLGWSATTISFGFVVGSFSGGFLSWAIGGILDRHGARVVSSVAGLIIALCMVGLATVQQPWHFWIAFGVARSVSASGAQLSTMVSVASWFVRKRGRAVGIIGTGQRLGQAVMPIPIFLIMQAYGWREAWVVLAALVVVMLVIPGGTLLRRRPEDHGLLPDGERSADGSTEALLAGAATAELTWTLAEAKKTRTLWLLIVAQGGVILCLNATNLHITAHLQDQGISFGLAVTATTIFAATSALTTLPWGLALERVHTRYVGLFATGLLSVAMVIAVVANSFPLAVAFAVIYGVAIGAWTVTSRLLFANYFGRRHFGSIRGFAAPIMVTANPLGPLLAGYIRDTTGSYDVAFAFFAVVFVVAFFAFLLATPPKKPAPAMP
jgi:MFS family permease